MENQRKSSSWETLKEFFVFAKPHKLWIILTIIACVGNALVDIAFAYILKPITDAAIDQQFDKLLESVLLMLLIIPFGVAIMFSVRYFSSRFAFLMIRDIRNYAARHVENLPVSYMENKHSGDMVARVTNNIFNMQMFMENQFYPIIFWAILFVGSFSYMLSVNWKLLLCALALVPAMMFIANRVSKPIRKQSQELQTHLGKINAITQDAIGGISMLKAFNLKDILLEIYNRHSMTALKKGLMIEKQSSLTAVVQILTNNAPNILCILYGGYMSVKGEITPGALISFMGLLESGIVRPIAFFPYYLSDVRRLVGSIDHLNEVLEVPVEREDGVASTGLDNKLPLELRDITFSYIEGQKNVLDGLSFRLEKGKTLALVGSSGCGKSTVFKIICEFYKPRKGQVVLYGEPLEHWNLDEARKMLSLVSQDTYLFPMTIAENISHGNPEATLDEIIEAAKAANAHDFIMELSSGYHTLVGERGVKLSGGQRQRVSLARAILKNAPILLLDEPTSALDTESETLVQEALDKFMKDRCVIVIAHRLSTIKNADEVLVMDDGHIAERGTHEQLMGNDGLYRQLYMKQFASQDLKNVVESGEGA